MKASGLTATVLTALLLFAGQAHADEKIRVLVMDNLASITLHFPADFEVKDKTGMGLVADDGSGGTELALDKDNGPADGVRVFAGDSAVNINEFSLTGVIEIKRGKKGRFRIINELGIEDYTRAVVGEEMPSSWPIEALKAQAVLARTYALYRKSRAGSADYDLDASVNSQSFSGDAREKDKPALAAKLTEGEVLTYGGETVEPLYHSTCGGITEDVRDVWDFSLPYLKPQGCDCRRESPMASWKRTLSAVDIEKALSDNGYDTADVADVKVTAISDTGRAKKVRVKAASGGAMLTGVEFRRIIGYSRLPSTCFTVRKEGDSYVFSGKGSGHGVGLCQWGAKVMAGEGKDYKEILLHYFPGTTLTKGDTAEGR